MKVSFRTIRPLLPGPGARSLTSLSVLVVLGFAVSCSSPVDPGQPGTTAGTTAGTTDSTGSVTTGMGSGGLVGTDTTSGGVGASGGMFGTGGGPGPGSGGGGGIISPSGGGPNGSSGGNDGGGGAPTGSGFQETGTMANCTFTLNGVPATEMPTVGVVDFTVTGLATAVSGGVIQFGLDTAYGLEAPVDLAAPNNKTLMLGMKKSSTYHYRVGVSTGTEFCYSQDMTIATGGLRSGVSELSQKMITGTVAPGFIVAATGSTATIYDQDGDVVWGYKFNAGGAGPVAGIFSAKMSYDGKYMIARDLGPFDAGNQGKFFSVAMDGSGPTDFDVEGGDHHDFTITPTGIAYIAKKAMGQYDQIFTANIDGSNDQVLADLQPLVDAYPQAMTSGEKSHVNAIHFWESKNIYTVSNRESDVIGMVSASGQILKSVGKQATASFPTILADGAQGGAGTQVWRVQHGHDWYADDKLLVFSNGSFSGGMSHVLHYTITGSTAKLDWQYTAMGTSPTQGDVQMLPNGNVLITSSTTGNMHQIDSTQKLVANFKASSFGYVTHRPTLYGPPPDGR